MDMLGPVLKEWYWLVIIGSIFSLAFTPSFLKAKCPKCSKRRLHSVDVDEFMLASFGQLGLKPYTSFHACDACGGRFLRERSGPLQDASDSRWQTAFDPVAQK